ncbi:hypothetical protein CS022_22080 [Veronia nyctiphanis]|uniref:Lipid/polyisoprenoid-binding YceI-like domain-containing protein n=1 Tax=Veronia nyctiphanis TaxID=1278244 RepID=A0A4Q0YK89_9GAMM|nr:hypothetical protein [Veronia nyctiphanis]RXJ70873.1 hypothetical protein CS022_22080 [Veronia nyctiphanis]
MKLGHLPVVVFIALSSASTFASQGTESVVSGGMKYDLVDTSDVAVYSQFAFASQTGLHAGRQVINRALNIKGEVTGNLIIESSEKSALTFDDPLMKKVNIAAGFWLLKFPPETELASKLVWVRQQPGVLSAEIEVKNNLKQLDKFKNNEQVVQCHRLFSFP